MNEPSGRPGFRMETALIWATVVLFTLALTVHADVSRINLDRHGDMVENYAWGTLWQWGYYKHPPFFGWLTAAWFSVFPRIETNYFFFSALNSALALLAVWRIAARYGDARLQLLAVYCAAVVPPIAFLAIKYNANSAMTPVWAWLFVFYLRGLERGKLLDAAILGILAGIAMLTKYHSGVLLAALFAHGLIDKKARPLLLSLFGAVTLAAFLVVMVPHVLWLFRNEFRPFVYAASQGDGLWFDVFYSAVKFVLAIPLYALPALLLALFLHDKTDISAPAYRNGIRSLTETVQGRALLVMCVGPTILTVILGIAAGAEISAGWSIPFYTPFSVLIAYLVPAALRQTNMRRATTAVMVYFAAMIGSAPIIKYLERGNTVSNLSVPIANVAKAVDGIWSRQGSGQPGFYIAGEIFLANGVSFYSKYDPLIVEGNSLAFSRDYVNRKLLVRTGAMAICLSSDTECITAVGKIMPKSAFRQPLIVLGLDGTTKWRFTVWVLPPRG
ncbi:glycosyltransferase family 39 protein [Oryzicola mucosus]|uniref:Glycosyltransferase family 39 protein n=1 Tax=Oryzicola mucosus TaxID=2767425 RepID=A0A8J6PQR4_9HYPH|nr:glycosyltransferase family 39 protein [Oryzicola mucosus]MBD0413309.1 glycosyltransferase family 39 protein [Oryzicola mucosus]